MSVAQTTHIALPPPKLSSKWVTDVVIYANFVKIGTGVSASWGFEISPFPYTLHCSLRDKQLRDTTEPIVYSDTVGLMWHLERHSYWVTNEMLWMVYCVVLLPVALNDLQGALQLMLLLHSQTDELEWSHLSILARHEPWHVQKWFITGHVLHRKSTFY